jgi:hypothetical protein
MKKGAVVVASAPKSIATLSGGKDAQRRFEKAVRAIWGKAKDGELRRVGKGGILSGVSIEQALNILNVPADVKGEGVRWVHRTIQGADCYFVTPEQGKSFDGSVCFNAIGCAEIWNPATGKISAVDSRVEDGCSSVNLSLPQGGSCFVVFHNGESAAKEKSLSAAKEKALAGEWRLSFPEGWGAPEALTIKELKSWNALDVSAEAKAFSGTVIYSTSFVADGSMLDAPLMLDLGRVNMIAVVKINGKKMGTLWCAPYSLDISSAVVEGKNELEIEVTSTWFNRLVYDASLPENERKTWTIAGPSADSSLQECGLMGPVKLIY